MDDAVPGLLQRDRRAGGLGRHRLHCGGEAAQRLVAAGAALREDLDPRPPVGDEAERFAARLVRAREEALLTNRAVAVEATTTGYAFSSFDGVQWSPLTDGPFGEERWAEDTAARPEGLPADAPLRVVFDPTGVADAASLTLSRGPRAVTVAVDAAGEVRVDG